MGWGIGIVREVTKVVLPILALFAYAVGMVWGTPPASYRAPSTGSPAALLAQFSEKAYEAESIKSLPVA